MRENLVKVMNDLLQTRTEEEQVVCFIADLQALNDPKLDGLLKFYRLGITRGPGFEQMYTRVHTQMIELEKSDAERDKQTAQSEPAQATPKV